MADPPDVIVTDRLTKHFGDHVALDAVSLEVRRGEVYGFLGPNGAGKTTTIRLLLGLLAPTAGTARVLGLDPQQDGVRVRARLGNLPADFTFDARATGRRLLGLLADLRGGHDASWTAELVTRFGCPLDRPLGELSRGNRQKVGIVQALAHRPELVVMDEPTAGLDPLMQEEFDRLVGELRDGGTTVLISSHNLTEVERLCDRVGVVRHGRLVAQQDVAGLRGRAVRRVTVTFADPADVPAVAALTAATDVRVDGRRVALTLAGGLDELLAAIAGRPVVDLEVTRPSLEEAFLALYADGTAA